MNGFLSINVRNMDEKINNIETTLAHHDLQIQDLSEMISMQWKEIERLKLRLERADAKISEMESAGDGGKKEMSVSEIAASEKPPHY